MQDSSWTRSGLLLAAAALALVLSGCPRTGVVCPAGYTQCGEVCVDPNTDRLNCGACGVACQALQVCQQGGCQCREGTTLCGATCATLETDNQNCGACGNACGTGEACQAGSCQPTPSCGGVSCGANEVCQDVQCVCAEGFTRCGDTCVNTQTDALNCGACGSTCADVQACRGGACTYDMAAACQYTGQVVGLQASGQVGPPVQLPGTGPQSMASFRDSILVADIDQQLRQLARARFTPRSGETPVGSSPNFILAADPYIYVVNSLSNTLQVLEHNGTRVPTDGGFGQEEGLSLVTVAELQLGADTSPQSIAKVDNTLYIPLGGGFGTAEKAQAGQKVARVDVTDPKAPVRGEDISLAGLDLQTFQGSQSFPYPQTITVHQGDLYVALTNLDPATYSPGGPGLLAKIDLPAATVSVVPLDPERCLNAGYVQSLGEQLAVSCIGRVQYTPDWSAVESVEKSAVLLLGANDQVLGSVPFACSAEASGCAPPAASRFAVLGNRLFVGDQLGGRVAILTATETGLVEERGFSAGVPAPVQVCPPAASGGNNVAEIIPVP